MSDRDNRTGSSCSTLDTLKISVSVSNIKYQTSAVLKPAVDVIGIMIIPGTRPGRDWCTVTNIKKKKKQYYTAEHFLTTFVEFQNVNSCYSG